MAVAADEEGISFTNKCLYNSIWRLGEGLIIQEKHGKSYNFILRVNKKLNSQCILSFRSAHLTICMIFNERKQKISSYMYLRSSYFSSTYFANIKFCLHLFYKLLSNSRLYRNQLLYFSSWNTIICKMALYFSNKTNSWR